MKDEGDEIEEQFLDTLSPLRAGLYGDLLSGSAHSAAGNIFQVLSAAEIVPGGFRLVPGPVSANIAGTSSGRTGNTVQTNQF